MEAVTTQRMRILDANSEWFGVPAMELMENAGRAVAAEANKLGESFCVVCGPGNNGGDGFAAARYLKSRPAIFYLARPRSPEACENYLRAKNYRPVLLNQKTLPRLEKALAECDVVVDALFGTGVKGKMREPARSAIRLINDSGREVLSVDVPTGMDPDTGKTGDVAVEADVTVTMHRAKTGLLKSRKAAGRIVVADIGIHPNAYTHIGKGDFKFLYPRREEGAHKGEAGKVLVVGGSAQYTGAPYFAGMAALRAGCDLAYVAAPKLPADRIAQMGPDLIVHPMSADGEITKKDVKAILAKDFDVLCIGNGLGDSKESLAAAKDVMSKCKRPMVIDGDALKASKTLLPKLKKNVVLTPHAGEFKRLFKLAPNEKNLLRVARERKCAILLKGPNDMIAQGKLLKLNESGNPCMSKGGTGDVLAGLCAGFLAQGVEPFLAACFAALVNGVAGDLAYTEESVAFTASDLLESIGMAEAILLE